MHTFRTAIVPAAGLGTRLLPITKTVPKELLPLVDRPAVEWVAEEATAAGAGRLVLVTSPGKSVVAEHFAVDPELEEALRRRGKDVVLDKLRRAREVASLATVVQPRPLGLGDAVRCAEDALDDDEDVVAVLLPDDLLLPGGVLDTMAAVRRARGGSVLCAVDVPRDEVSAYGILDTEPVAGGGGTVLRVRGMVEKPDAAEAPSTLAAAGRYLLDRRVFAALRGTGPGAGGEVQLTDAIATLIAEGHPVHVVVHRGVRHDLGTPTGYLCAAIDLALESDEYGAAVRRWLGRRLAWAGAA